MQLKEPLLWGDLVSMARPYTKWSYEIPSPTDLPRAVRRALKVALTPPTGPVFLSLPMDVLEESADVDLAPTARPDLRPGPLPELLDRAIARRGYDVYIEGGKAGVVTSGTQTPFLKKAIGMAYVPPASAAPGTPIEIDVRGRRVPAVVVSMPFYSRDRRA